MSNKKVLPLPEYKLGRYTSINEAAFVPGLLKKAKNIVYREGAPRPRDGYQPFISGWGQPLKRVSSYQRQSDGSQLFITTGGGHIGIFDVNGNQIGADLSTTEPDDDFAFSAGAFSLYMSSTKNAYKIDDNAGVDTLKPWGLPAPLAAPTLTTTPGTFNLTYGRKYCYSYVAYWTDSQGTLRFHIGAPSPFSGHTGALANMVPVLGGFAPAPNAFITHIWVFATADSPEDTSGTFTFAAEIPIGTATYADTLPDTALDFTRLAPFDNIQPTPAGIVVDFANVIALINGDKVQLTGGVDDIDLGIPSECAPPLKNFTVPTGTKKFVGGCNAFNGLYGATNEGWYLFQGTDASNFTEQNRVITPGLAGKKLVLVTPAYMFFVSPDLNLWKWNPSLPVPYPVSPALMGDGAQDELSFNDMTNIADAELRILLNRTNLYIVLAVSADNSANKNWIQMWDITGLLKEIPLVAVAPYPVETDFIPSHNIRTVESAVMPDGKPYLLLGDDSGNVYQYPKGLDDAGTKFPVMLETPWEDYGIGEVSVGYWYNIYTNRENARGLFKVYCAGSDGMSKSPQFVELPTAEIQSPEKDTTRFRARLQIDKVQRCRYRRLRIVFPNGLEDDENMSIISKMEFVFKGVERTDR